MNMSTPLKVLLWDIETAPGTTYYWRPMVRFIPHHMVITEPFMICWSAKWLGDKRIMSDYLTPAEVAAHDDSRIVASMVELIHEADVIVAHNGDKFDEPFLRGRVFVNDLAPLGPVTSIDTKKMAAYDFDLPHNNLNAIAKLRDFGEKDKTDFSWWTDILEGSKSAMNRMVRYNRKDVRILEEVFNAMRPHVRKIARLYDTVGIACKNCGSLNVQKRGTRKHRTDASTFQRYFCNDCQRYYRYKKREAEDGDLR